MKGRYQVKKIANGKMMLLSCFDTREAAFDYAIKWSNQNQQSSFIYYCNAVKASYFTHRTGDNNYQLFK